MSIKDFVPNNVKTSNGFLFDSLIKTFDDYLFAQSLFWENYRSNLVNPMIMPESLLDWKATLPSSSWRNLWDTDWSVSTKRLLLRDENFIFKRLLYPETLSLLFQHFNVLAQVKYTTGFVLKSSLPQTLSNNIFNYKVIVSKTYFPGTIERNIVDFLVDNFGSPINVSVEYEP